MNWVDSNTLSFLPLDGELTDLVNGSSWANTGCVFTTIGSVRALKLDAYTTGIRRNITNNNSILTLECHFYYNTAWSNHMFLLDLGGYYRGSLSFYSGSIEFSFSPGGGGYYIGVTGINPALVMGNWYHVALTYDGSALTCFIDGKQIGTRAGTVALASQYCSVFSVGDGSTGYFINSTVKNVRLSNTVRYTATFTPPPLISPKSSFIYNKTTSLFLPTRISKL